MITPRRAEFLSTIRSLETQRAARQESPFSGPANSPSGTLPESFMQRMLTDYPQGGHVLDAACASQPSWTRLARGGFEISAYHPAARVIEGAQSLFPHSRFGILSWRDVQDHERFDVLLYEQGMDFIPPEDWPLALNHFWNALRPGGMLYLAWDADPNESSTAAPDPARVQDLPLVTGETVSGDPPSSYRYTPQPDQVKAWLWMAGFSIMDEISAGSRKHILARKRRLSTNLLDFDIDNRATSQSP